MAVFSIDRNPLSLDIAYFQIIRSKIKPIWAVGNFACHRFSVCPKSSPRTLHIGCVRPAGKPQSDLAQQFIKDPYTWIPLRSAVVISAT
jgi:hypothetical protein